MKVGMAYPAFFNDFIKFFPTLEIVKSDQIDKLDLIIFSGGADIDPQIYGQFNTHSYIIPSRDDRELYVLKKSLELNKKILGICRGHQLINAYLGGDLIQDLFTYGKEHEGNHELNFLVTNSIAEKFFSSGVNSLHHQGVVQIGAGLMPTSEYNGVIESTESENIISVQWHPEFMYNREFFEYIKEWACS